MIWDLYYFVGDYLIRGSYISVLIVMITAKLFKNYNPKISFSIMRWLLIIYPAVYILLAVSKLFGPEEDSFVFWNRISGPHWWAYTTMITFGLFPLLLLCRKLGRKPWFILLCSFMINSGLIGEFLVIRYLHYNITYHELMVLICGIVLGIIVILVGNFLNHPLDSKSKEH